MACKTTKVKSQDGAHRMQFWGTHQLADVIAPRQEEDARVILLPMGDHKSEHDAQKDEKATLGWDAESTTAEDRVHAKRHEEGGPAVQAVVEEFSQRAGRSRASRLFPINAIQRVCPKHASGCQQPTPGGDGWVLRVAVIRGIESRVVVGEECILANQQKKTSQREDIGCHPARTELEQDTVSEGTFHDKCK